MKLLGNVTEYDVHSLLGRAENSGLRTFVFPQQRHHLRREQRRGVDVYQTIQYNASFLSLPLPEKVSESLTVQRSPFPRL